ncbi:hypothetical protein BH09GEM1_BH09GEM1_30230 [soil metagenome]
MAKEPEEVVMHGRSLVCHHCGGSLFHERAVAAHAASEASALGLGFLTDDAAWCLTCSTCGHMHTFMRPRPFR